MDRSKLYIKNNILISKGNNFKGASVSFSLSPSFSMQAGSPDPDFYSCLRRCASHADCNSVAHRDDDGTCLMLKAGLEFNDDSGVRAARAKGCGDCMEVRSGQELIGERLLRSD